MTAHWIKFWPESWQAGTQFMTAVEEYVYFRLCMAMWDTGKTVPMDRVPVLCKYVDGWEEALEKLIDDGKVKKKRLGDKIWLRNDLSLSSGRDAIDHTRTLSDAGKRGAKARWEKKKTGNGHPNGPPNGKANSLPNGPPNAEEKRRESSPLTPHADARGGLKINNDAQSKKATRASGTNPRRTATNQRHRREMEPDMQKLCWFCQRDAQTHVSMVYHCSEHQPQAAQLARQQPRPFGARSPDQPAYDPETLQQHESTDQ